MTSLILLFIYFGFAFHHSLMQQVFLPQMCASLCPSILLPSLTSFLEDLILLRSFSFLLSPHLLQIKASCPEMEGIRTSWPMVMLSSLHLVEVAWRPQRWREAGFPHSWSSQSDQEREQTHRRNGREHGLDQRSPVN